MIAGRMGLADERRRVLDAMGLGPLWVRRDDSRQRDPASDRSGQAVDEAARRAHGIYALGTRAAAAGDEVVASDFVIVGVAPGADDRAGEPSAREARKLLDAMLAAIGRARLDDASTTVVACRSGEPSSQDIERWRSPLLQEIALLAPATILAMGAAAGAALSGTEAPPAVRGVERSLPGGNGSITVVTTHHPARLLREPHLKAEAWVDLCLARTVHERLRDAS